MTSIRRLRLRILNTLRVPTFNRIYCQLQIHPFSVVFPIMALFQCSPIFSSCNKIKNSKCKSHQAVPQNSLVSLVKNSLDSPVKELPWPFGNAEECLLQQTKALQSYPLTPIGASISLPSLVPPFTLLLHDLGVSEPVCHELFITPEYSAETRSTLG